MAQLIERLLNDAVLGFFALLSLFLLITPFVFPLSPAAGDALLAIEYAIIGLFVLEYGAAWALADDKSAFMLNRWRLIDAFIIVAALFTLLPVGADILRNSPALRLLRLGRLASLGTRSSLALSASATAPGPAVTAAPGDVQVRALRTSGRGLEELTWQAGLERIENAAPDWLFISGVSEDRLIPIASALRVPEKAVLALFQSSVPRFDRLEQFSTLFVRYPLAIVADGRLRRTPVLLIGTADNVVVLCREHTDLERRVEDRLAGLDAAMPRMVRATVALIGEIVRAYTAVLEHLESSLITLESQQVALKDEAFLAATFHLRADILRVRSSLKHLKSVVRDLSQGNLLLAGSDAGDRELFRFLADDTADLYDGIEDLRDSLQALVDLRLNVSSFQMNRVMRLLALLTALALIPATAGGLLGMNLTDTPWPATLAQVAFGVAAGMGLSLYVFAIKGWLR